MIQNLNIKSVGHDPTTDFAVDELKKYLNKIVEKNDISQSPDYELIIQKSKGNDQVLIEQNNNLCKIIGNRKIALLIGVYQYLRILGIYLELHLI